MIVILIKKMLVLKLQGQFYFLRLINVFQMTTLCALLLINFLQFFNYIMKEGMVPFLYYIWGICSLFSIVTIYIYLKTFSLIAKLFDIIVYSVKTSSSFFFVILVNFSIFSLIGCSLYGGSSTSKSGELFLKVTGGSLNPGYNELHFNDFLNGLVFCWTLVIESNMPTLVNNVSLLRVVHGETKFMKVRDNRASFFFFFVLVNNIFLWNIFVGQIIGELCDFGQF